MAKINVSARRLSHFQGRGRMDAALGTVAYSGRIVGTNVGPPAILRSVSQVYLRAGTMESTEHLATHALAKNIMSMMGCMPLFETVYNNPSYSLLSNATDDEIVNNPNKFDAHYFANLIPGTIQINEIFKNTESAIFNLDADIPINIQIQNKKAAEILQKGKADYTRVAAKTVSYNLSLATNHTVRALRLI